MAGIGLAFLWLGYAMAFYGYDQITGGNDPFLSLIVPGRYSVQPRDDAGLTVGSPPSPGFKKVPSGESPPPAGGGGHVPPGGMSR